MNKSNSEKSWLQEMSWLRNWDLWFLLVITLSITIIDMFSTYFLDAQLFPRELFSTFILMTLALMGIRLLRDDKEQLLKSFDELKDNQSRLLTKLSEIGARVPASLTIVEPSRDTWIWDGFEGHYYAINAPWQVESESDESFDALVAMHAKRYENERFIAAHYVIFRGTADTPPAYPKAEDNFARFASALAEKSDAATSKVKVSVLESPSPCFTAFLGERPWPSLNGGIPAIPKRQNLSECSIVYIGGRPFVNANGHPRLAFLVFDARFNQALRDQITSTIHTVTNEEIPLDRFLSMRKQERTENQRRTN